MEDVGEPAANMDSAVPDELYLATPSAKRQKCTNDDSPSPFRITASNAVVLYTESSTSTVPPSMHELITAPTRSLLVGPDQVHTTVHANLFRGISLPLHNLLNSHSLGHSDINEVLRFDDTEAFLQLVRTAYRIAATENSQTASTWTGIKEDSQPPTKSSLICGACKNGTMTLEVECTNCDRVCRDGLGSFLEQVFSNNLRNSLESVSSTQGSLLEAPLEAKDSNGKPYPLLHYAKVWALAAKYAVYGLQAAAYRGFQKRLKRYAKIDESVRDVDELLDVLKYLNGSTPATVKAPQTSTPSLMNVVMRFVASQLDALLQEHEFCELMLHNGIIGLELAGVIGEAMELSK